MDITVNLFREKSLFETHSILIPNWLPTVIGHYQSHHTYLDLVIDLIQDDQETSETANKHCPSATEEIRIYQCESSYFWNIRRYARCDRILMLPR